MRNASNFNNENEIDEVNKFVLCGKGGAWLGTDKRIAAASVFIAVSHGKTPADARAGLIVRPRQRAKCTETFLFSEPTDNAILYSVNILKGWEYRNVMKTNENLLKCK